MFPTGLSRNASMNEKYYHTVILLITCQAQSNVLVVLHTAMLH